MPSSPFTVGLDLGQSNDFTALAAVRRVPGTRPIVYEVPALQRVRGLPYIGTVQSPGIVEKVRAYLSSPLLAGCQLVVDRTGVGRAIVDAFRVGKLPCVLWALTVTAGDLVREEMLDLYVPKKDLVGAAQTLLESGRLRIAEALPLAETLRTELKNFTVKVTAAGNETFGEWRSGKHDDLVFAVAMACWHAERYPPCVPGSIGRSAHRSPFAGAASPFKGGGFKGKPPGGW